ncbi:MAG: hypothetical protein RJA31_633 [Actinomycetota bacterium]|jgi:hypothetical protein
MKRTPIILSSVGVLAAVTAFGFVLGSNGLFTTPTSPFTTQSAFPTDSSQAQEPVDGSAADPTETAEINEMLTYLIEEEKLAHDVYIALNDIWDARVFANISRSESTHQDQVEMLLAEYSITDPRSSEPGVFVNDELQDLYDTLIAQGSESRTAAMEVGVLIEKTDITDLTDAMAAIDDPVIDATLQKLLDASYNHLDAFTRQI